MNPRYALYLNTTNKPNNVDFMAWIARAGVEYRKSIGARSDQSIGHDSGFDRFLEEISLTDEQKKTVESLMRLGDSRELAIKTSITHHQQPDNSEIYRLAYT